MPVDKLNMDVLTDNSYSIIPPIHRHIALISYIHEPLASWMNLMCDFIFMELTPAQILPTWIAHYADDLGFVRFPAVTPSCSSMKFKLC
jgi:hypothetical protein